MNGHEWEKDLVVLAADKNIEMAIRGLLTRFQSLGVRPITTEYLVHPEHDPGCARTPEIYLRSYLDNCRHALVLMDHEGSGREDVCRSELESQIEGLLWKNGWGDRAMAIVIAPELENWVWSDSPIVDEVLGWQSQSEQLRACLENKKLWPTDVTKPTRPKETMEWVLRQVRKPRSSAIYRQLAERVSLQRCSDPAFEKLKLTLQSWYPNH